MSDVNAAAESIVKEQFYVEARIGSHNYRNNAIGKPCRLIYGNGGNVPVDEILKPLADAYLALHPADDGDAIDEAAVVALCCYVVYTNQAIRRDARQLASRILEGIDQGRTPIGTRRVIAKSGLSQL